MQFRLKKSTIEEAGIGVFSTSHIKEGEKIPARSLIAGNPGKIIKQVTDEMIAWKTKGTELYQSLPKDMFEHGRICEPLNEMPADQRQQDGSYSSWKQTKK